MKNMRFWRTALVATLVLTVMLSVTGGTIAWFTDAVESKANVIQAGNLDVDVHVNGTTSIKDVNTLFNDVKLWEPGAVAWENLSVVNEGSLALKYEMTINPTNENDLNGNELSDVLKVAVVENGLVANVEREDVLGMKLNWVDFSTFVVEGDLTASATDVDTYGLVIYWQPSEQDNKWNANNGQTTSDGQPLHIDLGIKLQAAQLMAEEDAFGNKYDEDATFDGSVWTGATDNSWNTNESGVVDAEEYVITTAEQLADFAKQVNAGETFAGKTIKLGQNIDLNNAEWTPIGTSDKPFKGIFDGQDHTIANLKISGYNSNVGLFGYTTEGEIKNVHVHNASVSGRLNVGVVAGTPYTSKYTNIKVTGLVKVNGMAYVGGVGGKNAYADWTNITVNVKDGSYVKANSVENGTAYRTYVGGVIGFMGEGGHKVSNVTSNIDVYGSTCDVGGITGIAHYGNTFENVTCTGDVTITNANEVGDAEELGGIAGVWHNGGSNVTLNNCVFTGKLSANITEGVNLLDNTLTGNAYSASGTGKLIVDGNETVKVTTAEDVKAALAAGNNVVLTDDVATEAATTAPYGNKVGLIQNGGVIDGAGNTLSVKCYGDDYGIMTSGGTIKNLTIDRGCRAIMIMSPTEDIILDNLYVSGNILYPINTGEHATVEGIDLIVTNSTFGGWSSFAGIESASFTDCAFVSGKYGYGWPYDCLVKPYVNTLFKNTSFDADDSDKKYYLDMSALGAGCKVTMENCTVDGTVVTADNCTTLFGEVELPGDGRTLADCVIFK